MNYKNVNANTTSIPGWKISCNHGSWDSQIIDHNIHRHICKNWYCFLDNNSFGWGTGSIITTFSGTGRARWVSSTTFGFSVCLKGDAITA